MEPRFTPEQLYDRFGSVTDRMADNGDIKARGLFLSRSTPLQFPINVPEPERVRWAVRTRDDSPVLPNRPPYHVTTDELAAWLDGIEMGLDSAEAAEVYKVDEEDARHEAIYRAEMQGHEDTPSLQDTAPAEHFTEREGS